MAGTQISVSKGRGDGRDSDLSRQRRRGWQGLGSQRAKEEGMAGTQISAGKGKRDGRDSDLSGQRKRGSTPNSTLSPPGRLCIDLAGQCMVQIIVMFD